MLPGDQWLTLAIFTSLSAVYLWACHYTGRIDYLVGWNGEHVDGFDRVVDVVRRWGNWAIGIFLIYQLAERGIDWIWLPVLVLLGLEIAGQVVTDLAARSAKQDLDRLSESGHE